MKDNSWSIVSWASAVLLSVLVWPIATSAKDVTLALTTVEEGQSVALESRQQLWKSTYGGWIVTGWPYSMSVDQMRVYLFQTIDERLAMKLESDTKKANGGLDDVLNEIKGQPDKVQPADLMASRSERRSTITLDLAPGRHVLKPFNIEFTIGPDGLLASNDSRVRVDAKRDRIEIICHPVSIKLFSHGQSTHGPIRVTCGAISLLDGLEKQIAEFEKQNAGVLGAADGKGLRRVTLYLPASNPAASYEVNGVPFELDLAGSVRVPQTDRASVTGREIQLLANNTIEVPRPLGVRWFGASIKTTMSSGEKTVEVNGSGSDWLPVPSARSIKLGSEIVPLPVADTRWPHELVIWNVAESAAWSVAAASLAGSPGGEWTCRILPLTKTTPAAPAMLSVRLEPEPRAELGGPLGGQLGGELRLLSQGNGVYTGQLPEKTGLWRLTVHEPKQGARPEAAEAATAGATAGGGQESVRGTTPGPMRNSALGGVDSPWAGQPIGWVRIADKPPALSVSLYTDQNRGIVRRGDQVALRWSAKRSFVTPASESPAGASGTGTTPAVATPAVAGPAGAKPAGTTPAGARPAGAAFAGHTPAGTWPVVLRSARAETTVGQIVIRPQAGESAVQPADQHAPQRGHRTARGGDASVIAAGSLLLDTTALAPGEYTATIRAGDDVASYPLRLRVCQREPISDFELYTYVYNEAKPDGDSLVTGYYGNVPVSPGLEPFLADGNAAFDPLFAAYADAPAGPAREKFTRPSAEDLRYMALARLGMRAVPTLPWVLHHEEWNPKHTVPEELAQLRRRLALFTQSKADVPGFDGIIFGWFATLGGYWEESPPLDGHQQRRNAAADQWIAERVAEEMAKLAGRGLTSEQLKRQESWAAVRARSSILPRAFGEYLADARQIVPGLTAHNAIPSFWQGNSQSYAPTAYSSLTHRDSVDYFDYCLPPWGNFRAPAFMAMNNPQRQKLQCEFFTHLSRSEQFATAFGAAGRGLDGFSMTGASDELLRIFQRYGGWFSAHDPLPDVAVYYSGWSNQASVILHDLARLRRPGMLLSPEDVVAGELPRYKVLFLAGIGAGESPEVLTAFRDFEARGGVVIKDTLCHASLPGRSLSFGYDNTHVHNGWGLAYPNGEWEFAHLWKHFKEIREPSLNQAFATTPRIAVSTPSSDVVISPLAGKESILCFVINQTLVPLEVEGRWRQMFVLPRVGELLVEPGWHVRDVLAGKAVAVEQRQAAGATADTRSIPVDFTRAEGALFLLTRREPKSMSLSTMRTSATNLRLNAWLADEKDQPLPDPMPFEVTLATADGQILFRKFTALSPDLSLDVPLSALPSDVKVQLTVRDLILGCRGTADVGPAVAVASQTSRAENVSQLGVSRSVTSGTGAAQSGAAQSEVAPNRLVGSTSPTSQSLPASETSAADFVGGEEPVAAFLRQRKGPVTILLDEGQEAFRMAAEQLAATLQEAGRGARVVVFRPDEVRPLPLRWKPLPEDIALVEQLREGKTFVSRVALGAVTKTDARNGTKSVVFDDPKCGYDEYGPRLRHDADIVLFGAPAGNRALAELSPHLRRVPTASQPAAGGYFIHYLWSPFQGGFDGLYVGCHDEVGATAAVARLANLKPTAASKREPTASSTPRAAPTQRDKLVEVSGAAAARGSVAARVSSEPSEATVIRGGPPSPLENLIAGKIGSAVLNVAFAPDGSRIFVTTAAIGDSLFAVSPGGEVQERRSRYIGRQNFWAPYDGLLEAIDGRTVKVGVGGTQHRFSFDKGWLSRIPAPPTGLNGPFSIPIGGSTVLIDAPRELTLIGGARKLHAVDGQGRLRWVYDDASRRHSNSDLLYPRSLFPRAVTIDGRVLLVSGFGIRHDVYSRGTVVNASVCGLEMATGKLLWERVDWVLNQGKVVAATDRFLVIDDAGETQLIDGASGDTLSRMPSVAGSDWVLPVTGSDSLLIVENQAFDRSGRTARAFLRPMSGGADRALPIVGRVTDVLVAPDGQSMICVSVNGLTQRFSADGRLLWQSETPSGGIARLSPDGSTVLVGARDGQLYWLAMTDGKRIRSVDFNPYNVTTPEQFVKQLDSAGSLPLDPSLTAPPPPPEPSYLATLADKAVKFEPNLMTAEQLRRVAIPAASRPDDPFTSQGGTVNRLASDASWTLQVVAGKTYLVELLAAAAEPDKLTPHTRLEISVEGKRKTGNLPYTARLPIDRYLTRRRAAFRADETGPVTFMLRAVEPTTGSAESKQPTLSFESAKTSEAGVLAAELVVSAMNFGGRNLVYDSAAKATLESDSARGRGPRLDPVASAATTGSGKPAGNFSCLVMPWTGGNSTVRHEPYPCPLTSLRLVDGVIANQETAWTTQVRGEAIDRAECRVRFKQPQEVRSIAIYEDSSGPIADKNSVKERATPRFAVYVHDSVKKQWHLAGVVVDNTQLVHIFACPVGTIDEIHYFWAGRTDASKTDGVVRLAELEAYSADELTSVLGDDLDSLLGDKPDSRRGKK